MCEGIERGENVKKLVGVMKYLGWEGREFYFVRVRLEKCVSDDGRVLGDFMGKCKGMWGEGIRRKDKLGCVDIWGVIKKECR